MFQLRAILKTAFGILLLAAAGLSCGKEQPPLPPPEVLVTPVIQRDEPLYSEYVGQVGGADDINIRARVAGFVEGIHFKEGTRVKKGDLLYTIDPREYQAHVDQAKGQVAEARTQLADAELDVSRFEPLAAMNAVSQRDLDNALARRDAAKGAVEAAQGSLDLAEINLGYCRVTAPISGLIGKTQAKVGDYVGQPPNPVILNTVSDIDSVVVEFSVSETDYLLFMKRKTGGKPEDVRGEGLTLLLSDGSEFPHPGTVSFADRQVDPQTGTLLIQASFPNPDWILRPGQFARVRGRTNVRKGALLVPQRSVQELQSLSQIWVVDSGNIAHARTVRLGPKVGSLWIVEQGLEAGEKVVVEGLQKVKDGRPVEAKMSQESPDEGASGDGEKAGG